MFVSPHSRFCWNFWPIEHPLDALDISWAAASFLFFSKIIFSKLVVRSIVLFPE